MKTGKTIVELATELTRRADAKRDYMAPTRELVLANTGDQLAMTTPQGLETFGLTRNAERQLGTWAGIPAKYYERMRDAAPELLAQNVNHWLMAQNDNRLVRTLDGDVRAFLSDRYRRIDNEDIAQAVLPILLDSPEIDVVSCDVTDSKMYIKALFPGIQADIKVGDTVQAGISISNSETGGGAAVVNPLLYRLVCANGMIAQAHGVRRMHLGRKTEGDGANAYEIFRDETLAADDKALMMKLTDVVKAAASQQTFNVLVEQMREATEGVKIKNPPKAVEFLGKNLGLNETERFSVLENLIRDGDYSRYGALNAVTAVANNHEDYDRATEFESFGGAILDLSRGEWERVAVAA